MSEHDDPKREAPESVTVDLESTDPEQEALDLGPPPDELDDLSDTVIDMPAFVPPDGDADGSADDLTDTSDQMEATEIDPSDG